MICISVTPESRKLAKVDLLNASRQCDLVELCLDHLLKTPDVGDLIAGQQTPVLVSCRPPVQGGHFQGTEDERLALLRQAIVAEPAYIELDLAVAAKIPRFGKTQRVISFTSLTEPLGDVESLFLQAVRADADVVKFSCPTPTLDAVWPLLAAVTKKRDLPVIAQGLGRAGLMFSLLGRKYQSPWLYAALEKGMEAYPGQATIRELDEVYAWREIDAKTRFIGICGFGVSENAAVRFLNAAFQQEELNTRCLPLALGRFERLEKMLETLGVNALFISPSLGEAVLEFAPQAEDASRETRFTDLLLKQPAGWTAYNSLWRSTVRVVEKTLAAETESPTPFAGRNVLVIGANGTARAIIFGLLRRDAVISVTDPDDDAALAIAKSFDIRHVPFAAVYDSLAEIVVFTDAAIPVGNRSTELNPSLLRPNMTVVDVSCMPDESTFLKEAHGRGCRIIDPAAIFTDKMATLFKSADTVSKKLGKITLRHIQDDIQGISGQFKNMAQQAADSSQQAIRQIGGMNRNLGDSLEQRSRQQHKLNIELKNMSNAGGGVAPGGATLTDRNSAAVLEQGQKELDAFGREIVKVNEDMEHLANTA
ncbi:MAG: type I 3-dehydroquinate dehydratase, partial [Planctomycetes bacterium]|nr:type I 3-dehydroquinate dehydratase [Planctomycetota bacterium]